MREVSYESLSQEQEVDAWEYTRRHKNKQVVFTKKPKSPARSITLEEEKGGLGTLIFILMLVFAFSVGVALYGILGTQQFLFANTTPKEEEIPLPVPTLDDLFIRLTDSPREQIIADMRIAFQKSFLPPGMERALVFQSTDGAGRNRSATAQEFLLATGVTPPPSALLQSLGLPISYHLTSNSTLSGSITLSARAYANTFAGMLAWEPHMAESLIPILDPTRKRSEVQALQGTPFADKDVLGVHTRILRDKNNAIALAYTFLDRKTVVVAGSEEALITRLTHTNAH